MSDQQSSTRPARSKRLAACGVCALVALTAVIAWARMGLLGLPDVPAGLTIEETGLEDLDAMGRLASYLRGGTKTPADAQDIEANRNAEAVKRGIAAIRDGNEAAGLQMIRDVMEAEPKNLVFSNAYRMEVFRLQREYLKSARLGSTLTPEFPPHLAGEPIATLTKLDTEHHSRETRLALALAWVDKMLLFPALEIKAPSSVESVNLLTDLIENGNPGYVPALFARGMNHLHRPARLVWPETMSTPRDAAVRDIGMCVAVGWRFNVGSDHLKATLAVALGDAYVKTGKLDVARSWWQIAQNLCHEDDIQSSVRRRYSWRDENILDELEAELDRCRSQLDRPMTDLAFMWN